MAIYLTPRHMKAPNYVCTQTFYVHRNVALTNIGGNSQEFPPHTLSLSLSIFVYFFIISLPPLIFP